MDIPKRGIDELDELKRLIDEAAKALVIQYGPDAAVEFRAHYPESRIRSMSSTERDQLVAYINGYLKMQSEGAKLAERLIGGFKESDPDV